MSTAEKTEPNMRAFGAMDHLYGTPANTICKKFGVESAVEDVERIHFCSISDLSHPYFSPAEDYLATCPKLSEQTFNWRHCAPEFLPIHSDTEMRDS